jgi:hypothetical protein
MKILQNTLPFVAGMNAKQGYGEGATPFRFFKKHHPLRQGVPKLKISRQLIYEKFWYQ